MSGCDWTIYPDVLLKCFSSSNLADFLSFFIISLFIYLYIIIFAKIPSYWRDVTTTTTQQFTGVVLYIYYYFDKIPLYWWDVKTTTAQLVWYYLFIYYYFAKNPTYWWGVTTATTQLVRYWVLPVTISRALNQHITHLHN